MYLQLALVLNDLSKCGHSNRSTA